MVMIFGIVLKTINRLHLRSKCLQFSSSLSSMTNVYVRSVEGEERLQITLKYPVSGSSVKPRVYNFDRLKNEELERTLTRISANVSKVVNKKSKPKKQAKTAEGESAEIDDVAVCLMDNDTPVDVNESNGTAWIAGRFLKIGEERFSVTMNIPTIKKITLPERILQDFEVTASAQLEFADESKCKFTWYRLNRGMSCDLDPSTVDSENSAELAETVVDSCHSGGSNSEGTGCSTKAVKRKSSSGSARANIVCSKVHDGRIYIPTADDVGCLLRVDCIPSDGEREGEPGTATASVPVTVGPPLCPFQKRHKYTEHLTDAGCFRIVTYNILADIYADSDFSRDILFPYCPPDILSMDYRKLLIMKELLGYNADVLCLQEVDKSLFNRDLSPRLSEAGFEGLLHLKAGDVSEGTATFYRKSKFSLISQHDIALSQALQEDPLFADLRDKISSSESLKEKVFERTSALQVTVLESSDNTNRRILVATVHLYFHPRAPHVRLLQSAICLRHIERVLAECEPLDGQRPAVIFCGDFNSYHEGGVHTLLTKKFVPARYADWYAAGKPDFVDGLELRHNLDLVSACGYPRYTNFVAGFSGCIDYIYVESNRLVPKNIVPLPSHEDVTEYTALPNVVFPSDHLALVCELAWTDHAVQKS